MTAPQAGAPAERDPTDRRGPRRGDERRAALLAALDQLLRDEDLERINVAEVSRRAGVSRSAFYFYFESKAMAVAALVEGLYDEAMEATAELASAATPAERIERTIRGLFDAWERHQHVYLAMLEARATSPAVRALWDHDRESFVGPVAALIRGERAEGRAPDGPDPEVLATVLLECNDRALERRALGGPPGREDHIDAITTIWLRTIYGRCDDEDPDDA